MKIFDDKFAGKLEPGSALSAEVLKKETVATEDAGTERLLESDFDFNLWCGAEKTNASSPR